MDEITVNTLFFFTTFINKLAIPDTTKRTIITPMEDRANVVRAEKSGLFTMDDSNPKLGISISFDTCPIV